MNNIMEHSWECFLAAHLHSNRHLVLIIYLSREVSFPPLGRFFALSFFCISGSDAVPAGVGRIFAAPTSLTKNMKNFFTN